MKLRVLNTWPVWLVVGIIIAGALVAALELAVQRAPNDQSTGSGGAAPQLHVSGNKLVNTSGQRVVLHGVNRSGGEFSCVNGAGHLPVVRWTRRRSPR